LTDWFNSTVQLASDEIYVSEISPCPEHRMPSISISQLFYYWEEPRAVVSIHVHTSALFAELLREVNFGKGSSAFLVDEAGNVIAHADPLHLGHIDADKELVASVLHGKGLVTEEQDVHNSRIMKKVYLPLRGNKAVIVVEQSLQEIMTISSNLKQHLIWISVIVALGLLVGLILITIKNISRPLALLEKTTKKIANGQLEARVNINTKDEIGSLSASFDTMADSLQFSQQELRHAKKSLESIFDNVIPLCITSRDFEVLKSNDAYNRVFGNPEEISGPVKCYDSRPGSACHTERCCLKLIMSGESEVAYEVKKTQSNGKELSFIVTSRPFLSADNELLGIVQSFQDITKRKQVEEERKKLVIELQNALAKVKLLSGFLPICANCKKIRDDKGYWNQIESYIRDHSEAEFSHSICPECSKKLYPEFDLSEKK